MSETLFAPSDRCPIFAVYCAGDCVFAGPRFAEVITERDRLPSIVESRAKLTACPPWQILANRFHLNGKEHTLLSFIPYRGTQAPTLAEAELAALPLTELVRSILACTDARFVTAEPLSPKLLFTTLAQSATVEICDRIRVSSSVGTKEGLTEIAPRGLFYAIGLLLASYYCGDGCDRASDVTFSLTSLPEEHQIRLTMPSQNVSGFLLDLLGALAAPSGFSVKYERDAFLFSLPAVHASALALRTHPEAELPDLLRTVRLLFTDRKNLSECTE